MLFSQGPVSPELEHAVIQGDLVQLQAEGDVLADRHEGEQRVSLVDDSPVPSRMGDRGAVHDHLPGLGRMGPQDRLQQRGFAGTAGADQGDELPPGDLEVDVVKDLAGVEPVVQALALDEDIGVLTWLLLAHRAVLTARTTGRANAGIG